MGLRGTISVLVLFAFWAGLVQKACSEKSFPQGSKPTIRVPGLLVGSVIHFKYYGDEDDLRRVTLSIEDDIGKFLHMELRHNEDCIDYPDPEIRLNTNIEGFFDPNPVVKSSPWFLTIPTGTDWVLITKQDGFLIASEKSVNGAGFEYKFKYSTSHYLSEVHKIQMYAKGCRSAKADFSAHLSLSQEIPRGFTKLSFRGSHQVDKAAFDFFSSNGFTSIHISKYFSDGSSLQLLTFPNLFIKTIVENYTNTTPIEFTIEKKSDGTYQLTVHIGASTYSAPFAGATEEAMTGMIYFGFTKFTKLELLQ